MWGNLSLFNWHHILFWGQPGKIEDCNFTEKKTKWTKFFPEIMQDKINQHGKDETSKIQKKKKTTKLSWPGIGHADLYGSFIRKSSREMCLKNWHPYHTSMQLIWKEQWLFKSLPNSTQWKKTIILAQYQFTIYFQWNFPNEGLPKTWFFLNSTVQLGNFILCSPSVKHS